MPRCLADGGDLPLTIHLILAAEVTARQAAGGASLGASRPAVRARPAKARHHTGPIPLRPLALLWAMLLAGWSPQPARAADGPGETAAELAACRRQVSAAPQSYLSHLCFFQVARQRPRSSHPQVWSQSVEALQTSRPPAGSDHGWTSLVLGYFATGRDNDDALHHFETAIPKLADHGETLGVVLAHANAHRILLRRGQHQTATQHLLAAQRSAAADDDPEATARALVLASSHRLNTGGDLGRAYADLQRAADLVSERQDLARLQSSILFELGRLAFELGRWQDAITTYEHLLTLRQAQKDAYGTAGIALNIAMARQGQLELTPDPAALPDLEARAEYALALANEEGSRINAARAHRMLAEVLISTRPTAAEAHIEACLTAAREIADRAIESSCHSVQGRLLAHGDPAAALAASRLGLDLAQQARSPLYEVFAWRSLVRAAWQALQRDAALEISHQALGTIDELRTAQQDPLTRAQLLSNWSTELAWLVGRLLEGEAPDLEQAFAIIERLRSPVLLESVEQAPTVDVTEAERRQIRKRIAAIQRRLLDPGLGSDQRRRLLSELDGWELQERFSVSPLTAEAQPTTAFIELRDIEASLRPDEAMLSFQIDLWTDFFGQAGGGAWVIVSTTEGSQRFAIDPALDLAPSVSIFLGLLQRRDGSETKVAQQLYGALLSDGLATLPTTIQRLILVPDGVLHHLPFAALRADADTEDPALGERFEIVLAPSASLWHRWRHDEVAPATRSLLALADPQLPSNPRHTDSTRNAVLLQGMRLGQLPHARREGKTIVRRLGGRLVVGAEASEHFVKQHDLAQYGVVHFASHAVADGQRAERSCLILTPGGLQEDGLLRSPEIADLDLEGRLVVLSACQTAAGELLRAEGILSLARAFFEARAHGVIGSRWPLRDADAFFFFEAFYRHLAADQSAATAMRSARRDAIAEGLPTVAWAGVSLMGHGDLKVSPEQGAGDSTSRWWLSGVGALLLGIGFLAWRTSRNA